jgi:hypothetical protein
METLEEHKAVDPIRLREALVLTQSVLADPTRQIVRHSGVQNAGTTGEQIEVIGSISQKQIPRLRSG